MGWKRETQGGEQGPAWTCVDLPGLGWELSLHGSEPHPKCPEGLPGQEGRSLTTVCLLLAHPIIE